MAKRVIRATSSLSTLQRIYKFKNRKTKVVCLTIKNGKVYKTNKKEKKLKNKEIIKNEEKKVEENIEKKEEETKEVKEEKKEDNSNEEKKEIKEEVKEDLPESKKKLENKFQSTSFSRDDYIVINKQVHLIKESDDNSIQVSGLTILKKNYNIIETSITHKVLVINENNNFFNIDVPLYVNLTWQTQLSVFAATNKLSYKQIALFYNGIVGTEKIEKKVGLDYKKDDKISFVISSSTVNLNFNNCGINNYTYYKRHYYMISLTNVFISVDDLDIVDVFLNKVDCKMKILEIDIHPNDILLKPNKKPENYSTFYKEGFLTAENYDLKYIQNNLCDLESQNKAKVLVEMNINWRKILSSLEDKNEDFLRTKVNVKFKNSKIYVIKLIYSRDDDFDFYSPDRPNVSFYYDSSKDDYSKESNSYNKPFMHCLADKKFIGIKGLEVTKSSLLLKN